MHSAHSKTDSKPQTAAANSPNKLAADFRALVSDAEEFLRSAGNSTDAAFNQARTRFEERIRQLKSRIPDVEGLAASRYREVVTTADRYVRNNPWPTVGAAAVAGALIGLLVARR